MHHLIAFAPFLCVPLFIYVFKIPMKDVVITGLVSIPVVIGFVALHKWNIKRRSGRT